MNQHFGGETLFPTTYVVGNRDSWCTTWCGIAQEGWAKFRGFKKVNYMMGAPRCKIVVHILVDRWNISALVYGRLLLGIWQTFKGRTAGPYRAYRSPLSGIQQAIIRHTAGLYRAYGRPLSGILQAFLWHRAGLPTRRQTFWCENAKTPH